MQKTRAAVFSNVCRVLSQCNTRLRLLYLLNKIGKKVLKHVENPCNRHQNTDNSCVGQVEQNTLFLPLKSVSAQVKLW